MRLSPGVKAALIKKARRDKAQKDIEYFVEYYLPHYIEDTTPPFHREIRRILMNKSRVGIAAPRGFAKSTNVQIIYGLYCLMYHKGEDILSISQSAQMAEDWIRRIKFELEGNDRLKEDFEGLLQWGEKDSKRWTAEHIVIQREGNVFSQMRARGRGCQVRGLRPTKVFCDDLEDDEEVRSEEQRKILRDWFLSALMNTLKHDQQLVVIGTILHPLGLLSEIINKKSESFEKWTIKKYKALNRGKSLWEARFPTKTLLKRKREIGTYAFEKEFQNNPIASDTCLWKPDWIRSYDKLPKILSKFVALDPAGKESESEDYSALVCLGIGEDDKIYEVETWRGQWGTWELVDRCIQFYSKHRPVRFGIEQVAFQSFIKPVLLKEASKYKLRIPIETLKLGKWTGMEKERREARDKYTRALSVVHYWEQGLVFLKNQDLIDELSVFPTGSHDDMVDAVVWAMKMIMKHHPIKIMVEEQIKPRFPTQSFMIKDDSMPGTGPIFQEENLGNWKLGT